jgi:hypothetical protein
MNVTGTGGRSLLSCCSGAASLMRIVTSSTAMEDKPPRVPILSSHVGLNPTRFEYNAWGEWKPSEEAPIATAISHDLPIQFGNRRPRAAVDVECGGDGLLVAPGTPLGKPCFEIRRRRGFAKLCHRPIE